MKVTILATMITMLGFASLYVEQQTIHGSGRVVKVSREVSGFNSVDMEGAGIIRIQQGDRRACASRRRIT